MFRSTAGRAVLAAVAALVGMRVARAAEATPESQLAWQLDAISSQALGPNKPQAAYQRSAALLEAAHRLDPSQPRFPRLRMLALMHVNDVDGAIGSLKEYRTIRPDDRNAQAQLVDLYASRMETVDQKIKYLTGLLGLANIPPEVRAHLAAECVELLAQRSPEEAAAMAKRAVELYPLAEATREYYERVARHQGLKEQVAGLVAVLSANPNQPTYAAELARLLASEGMADDSLQFYDMALLDIRPMPNRPPWFHDLLVDFAAELMIADKNQAADALLGQMLDADPADADAWFLKLALDKATAGDVTFGQTLDLARTGLARRWNMVADLIVKGAPATQPAANAAGATPAAGAGAAGAGGAAAAPATTQPVEPQDPAPVIAKLKAGGNPNEQLFVNAAFDLAWFNLYFDKKPEVARKWIDAIGAIVPASSDKLQLLEGWYNLALNQTAKARDILSKLTEKNPLAGLGLIRADEADKKQPDAGAAQKLLAEHRTGLVGALLWEALKGQTTRPATQPAASDLADVLKKFPVDWLDSVNPGTAHKVYSVRAEPVQTTVPYGEPVLMSVTLANSSDHDITIGQGAMLRPELWFDAQVMGLDLHSFPGVSYDQITGNLVLKANSSSTQIVRLDEGDLHQVLMQAPGTVTRLTGDVITNPLTIPQGVLPGPCGEASTFTRTVGYAGSPLAYGGRKRIDAAVASTSPLERMSALDLMTSYVRLSQQPNAEDELKKAVADFPGMIAKARTDPTPAVAAWADYLWASIAPPQEKDKEIHDMAASSDWRVRLLAVLASDFLPADSQKQVIAPIASGDADPTVKATAQATLDLLAHPATQPTTAPRTAPAPAPGT